MSACPTTTKRLSSSTVSFSSSCVTDSAREDDKPQLDLNAPFTMGILSVWPSTDMVPLISTRASLSVAITGLKSGYKVAEADGNELASVN